MIKIKPLMLALCSLTFQVQAHTLQEAVTQAVFMGPDVAIEANRRMQINQDLRAAYAGYLPSLDLAAGAGRQHSNNPTTRAAELVGTGDAAPTLTRTEFALSARQMLFDGFAVKSDVEGNMARMRAEAWRVNGSAQDIAAKVTQFYLRVLLQKKLVSLAKYNLDAHERVYAQIAKRTEAGIGRKADQDQAEGRLALARANLLSEQANLRDAQTNYMRYVGLPAENLMQPSSIDGHFPANERAAVSQATNNNPIVRAAIADVSVTKAAKLAAQSTYFPRIDVEAGLTRNHNIDGSPGPYDDFSVMLRGRYNLFRGGADVAKTNAAAWKIQEAQAVRNRAYREAEEAVKLAYSIYITAHQQTRYLKTHMDASERARDAYQQQFNIGQRTLLDLLDSENELYTARTQYVKAKNDEQLGKYRVLQQTGMLVQCLGVQMPEAAEFKVPTLFGMES